MRVIKVVEHKFQDGIKLDRNILDVCSIPFLDNIGLIIVAFATL